MPQVPELVTVLVSYPDPFTMRSLNELGYSSPLTK